MGQHMEARSGRLRAARRASPAADSGGGTLGVRFARARTTRRRLAIMAGRVDPSAQSCCLAFHRPGLSLQ